MTSDFTKSSTVTLNEFIRSEEARHPDSTGELTEVLLNIALATKTVSRGVNMAGLASMLGLTGDTNVQGEGVQKLDVYSDQVFEAILGRSAQILSMVSEEQEGVIRSANGNAGSRYVLAYDPLDGSSNIDVNVAIGSIWGLYKRVSTNGNKLIDFLQPGFNQVAAGYTIYGSSTMFVFTTGDGVNGFTLDPTIGEFMLTHPNMRIPKDGNMYSCNEGNSEKWSDGVKAYIKYIKQVPPKKEGEKKSDDRRPYSARYVGSLVADFHRTMLKGGLFLYPADSKNKNGKLRVLYECAPMAFVCEQAGGKASNGRAPVLNIIPESIHQRSPLFIGSSEMVEHVEAYIRDMG